MAVVITPQRVESPPPVPLAWDLTPAEQRVAELALRGLENAVIAARLFVGEETVRTHLGHVYEKLGIRGRNQLMACYYATIFAGVDLGT